MHYSGAQNAVYSAKAVKSVQQCVYPRESYARADVFLSENLTGYTRSAVKKLAEEGRLFVGGAVDAVHDAGADLSVNAAERIQAE
mgnify:CR=1 FL=1